MGLSWNEKLLDSCSKGYLSLIRQALEKGADPNARAERGKSALAFAIQARSVRAGACVKALLEAGAVMDPVEAWGAAFDRDQDARYSHGGYLCADWVRSAPEELFEAGLDPLILDKDQQDPLMKACWAFRVGAAERLLDLGADPLRRDRHGLQAIDRLLLAMMEQGSSAPAKPTVMLGFALLERLIEMGSDFERGRWGGPGPIQRLLDMRGGFPEVTELAAKLTANREKKELSETVEPASAPRPSPRI